MCHPMEDPATRKKRRGWKFGKGTVAGMFVALFLALMLLTAALAMRPAPRVTRVAVDTEDGMPCTIAFPEESQVCHNSFVCGFESLWLSDHVACTQRDARWACAGLPASVRGGENVDCVTHCTPYVRKRLDGYMLACQSARFCCALRVTSSSSFAGSLVVIMCIACATLVGGAVVFAREKQRHKTL